MTDSGSPMLIYQAPARAFASNRVRTILVLSALGCSVLLQVAVAGVGFMQLDLLNRVANHVPVTRAEAAANDMRYEAAHLVMLLTLILSGIFLMMWMYRAHKNLKSITTRTLEFTPGGAVGWWFCPFANLIKPYQVMKEILTVSVPRERGRAPVVGLWWTFWLFGNVVSQVGTAFIKKAEDQPTIPDLVRQTWATMADVPLYMAAGLLLMWIIWQVDRAQESRRNVVVEGGGAGG